MKRSLVRHYVLAAVIVATAFSVGKVIEASGHQLIVNTSPSMPSGIYWMVRNERSVRRGDVVMFAPPDAVGAMVYERGWLPDGMPLLKAVGGIAGDVYCLRGQRFIVDDRDIGPTFLLDTQGRPLPQIAGCRRVGTGEFLPVSGFIDRSFDGRYFGAVSLDSVLGVGHPLVTF